MRHARDHTGDVHGTFTVVCRVPKPAATSYSCSFWRLKCACGAERIQSAIYLNEVKRRGLQYPCLCAKGRRKYPNQKSLVNLRFGALTVTGQDMTRGPKRYWLCSCDCGGKTTVSTGNLINGHSKSCCGRRNRAAATHISPS